MEVVLYTTHCPKCRMLESQLRQAHIFFRTVEDEQVMVDKGFMEAPMLEVDNETLNYDQAIKRIKNNNLIKEP